MRETGELRSIRSFFPQIFASKLRAYTQGEPSVYLFNKVRPSSDPDAPTYFQRWILKAIESHNPKLSLDSDPTSVSAVDDLPGEVGIDISRMFDEIELRPEIMTEIEGESEYSLALSDLDRMKDRMTQINIEAANIFLNSTRDDLNDFTKSLLNDSMPGSYEKLIEILKPKDPKLDEIEKVARARQKLAYSFISATRVCYCQKLQDINSAQNASLPENDQRQNLARQQEYMRFYNTVISPIEALNRRPITNESFYFIEDNQETEEEMDARVQLEYKLASKSKNILEMYKSFVSDEPELRRINANIAALERMMQEVQVINDFQDLRLPVKEKMQNFLDNSVSDEIKEATKIGLIAIIQNIKSELTAFNEKAAKDLELCIMIQAELEKLDIAEQAEINYDLELPFDSPIYLIMNLGSVYENLNNLMHGVDETELASKAVDECRSIILDQIKAIAVVDGELKRVPVDQMNIIRAQQILSSPIIKLSREYASACDTSDEEKKNLLINQLEQYVDKEIVKLNLINLSRYLEDIGIESHSNTIKEISNYLHEFNDYSFADVQRMSNDNLIFKTAAELQEYDNLLKNENLRSPKLARKIRVNLEIIETWYKNQNLVISARTNLDILSAYINTLDESYNKAKLMLLINQAQSRLSDENVRFDDSRLIKKLLNTDIIKLANKCEIARSSDTDKIAIFNSELMALGSNTLRKDTRVSFQALKALFSNQTKKIDPADRDEVNPDSPSHQSRKGM